MASLIPTGSNAELAINVLSTQLNTKLKIAHPDLFARLPNELLEPILMSLKINMLIPLRLVSPRWNVMIESICHKKQQSLALVSRHFEVNLKDRFYGQLDLSQLVYLELKQIDPNFTVDLCTLLLFPRVEHLFVDRKILTTVNFDIFTRLLNLWSASLITLYFDGIIEKNSALQVCSQINAMTNLRNLDLSQDNMLPLNSLAPTLERLHSLSFDLFEFPQASYVLVVNILGPNCTTLRVNVFSQDLGDLPDWPIQHAQSPPITHLHLNAFVPQFVGFFLRNFPGQFAATLKSLQMSNHLANSYYLPASTLTQLFTLTQLTDIRIDGETQISLSRLDFHEAIPMPNIHSFSLASFRLKCAEPNYGELFCQFFSTIFPNLERLIVHNQEYQNWSTNSTILVFVQGLELL